MNLPVSLKTIANVLGIALLIAVVAPFVVYAVPGVVGAEHSFVVLTASMTPAIAPGDVVIVDERAPATIVDGDVITFVRGGNEVPVTHRVINVMDGPDGVAFETQGDANGAPDASLVPGESVLGVVAITIPYIGYVIQFTDSPLGFAALVVVPFGLLLISEVWSFARSRRETSSSDADETTPTQIAKTDAAAVVTEPDDGPVSAPDSDTAVASRTTPSAADSLDPTHSVHSTQSKPVGITVDAVIGASAVLAVFAPYSVYVAFQLRTALVFSVAVATTVLLLAALAMWISATGMFDRFGSSSNTTELRDDAQRSDVSDDISSTDGRNTSGEQPLAADGAGEDE